MIKTPEVKQIYASIQKQLFYLVPEKWDRIYLYASVTQQLFNLETGELFFYYFPKGILKKNPVNVYEIPNKFNLNEEEYIQLVEKLFKTIKQLRQVYIKNNEKLWTNLTIKIEGLKFEVEFNYEDITSSEYSNIERHIIWKYKYLELPVESFNRKERNIIKRYIEHTAFMEEDIEVYTEPIYKRPIKNLVDYNKEKRKEGFYKTENNEEKISKETKQKIEEQRYTYEKKARKGLRKQYRSKERK